MLERWYDTKLRGSKGKIYRKIINSVETSEFAEEYDNGVLCEVTPEGCEQIIKYCNLRKAA